MISIILKWHLAMSWKLGHCHGTDGRPYNRPWWVNEAHYALAYTYAKFVESSPVEEAVNLRLIDQGFKNAQ